MTDPLDPASPDAAVDSKTAAFPLVRDHELIGIIGRGSSGQVWLARNALGLCRGVKIVYERAFRHRRPFEQEFTGISNFEPISRLHEGFVDILQVGYNDEAGYFYCVMELADDVVGVQNIEPEQYVPRTLAHDLAQRRRLPVAECVRLGASVASALSFLHRHGLTHRDIKPSNIIFVNGQPKLADIGLVAEMSATSAYVGTEGFIPPEGPGTVQADIYSLGKVLYEISTGKDRNEYPELPELGQDAEDRSLIHLNKIILKACRADPGRRYQSADELMTDLVDFQTNKEPSPAREKVVRILIRLVEIAGLMIAAGVLAALCLHLVRLLKGAP